MCKQVTYTKYQKRVIKFLYDFLGNDYPFDYEKAQNNHLKVLIEGCLNLCIPAQPLQI